jgi:hypothetical protein
MNNIAVLKIKVFFKLCWVRSVQIIRETVRVGKDLNLRFPMFTHTYIHNVGTIAFFWLSLNVRFLLTPFKEKFEDTIGVIRIRISKRNWKTQWPKEKGEKDKQRSTKHTHKTQDRVTRTPLIIWGEPGAPKWLTVPAPLVALVVYI